jgi:holo-[acyl-carrier protein] synthase
MVIGIGVDTVDTARLEHALTRWGGRLLNRLFTVGEIQACSGKHDRIGSLAARFAAKEALFKAMGTGQRRGTGWKDAEVVSDASGSPRLVLSGRLKERVGRRRIHVSLSRDSRNAVAVVVIETVEE